MGKGAEGGGLRPPKVFKRHKKGEKGGGHRTCWRSIKWKIAILCCSSQGRKGIRDSTLLFNPQAPSFNTKVFFFGLCLDATREAH